MIRVAFCLVFASLALASHAAESTFESGNEDWTISNFDALAGTFSFVSFAAQSPTGGNPGGALFTGDASDYCFYGAPAKFLGNQAATFGTNLTYDTKSTSAVGDFPAAVLTSAAGTLFNFKPGPSASWTGTSIPLVGASWSHSAEPGGTPATDEELKAVLTHLTGLYVEADWHLDDGFPDDEVTGLDNVRLVGAVPEPAPYAVLVLGAFGLLRRRRASPSGGLSQRRP